MAGNQGDYTLGGDETKCRLLAHASGKNVLLLSGEPWIERGENKYNIKLFSSDNPDWDGAEGWEFGEGRRCAEEVWLVSDEYGAFTLKAVPHDRDNKYPLSGEYAGTIVSALASARGARFEHGESGGSSFSLNCAA